MKTANLSLSLLFFSLPKLLINIVAYLIKYRYIKVNKSHYLATDPWLRLHIEKHPHSCSKSNKYLELSKSKVNGKDLKWLSSTAGHSLYVCLSYILGVRIKIISLTTDFPWQKDALTFYCISKRQLTLESCKSTFQTWKSPKN